MQSHALHVQTQSTIPAICSLEVKSFTTRWYTYILKIIVLYLSLSWSPRWSQASPHLVTPMSCLLVACIWWWHVSVCFYNFVSLISSYFFCNSALLNVANILNEQENCPHKHADTICDNHKKPHQSVMSCLRIEICLPLGVWLKRLKLVKWSLGFEKPSNNILLSCNFKLVLDVVFALCYKTSIVLSSYRLGYWDMGKCGTILPSRGVSIVDDMSIACDIAKWFEQLETPVNFSWYIKEGERMLKLFHSNKEEMLHHSNVFRMLL